MCCSEMEREQEKREMMRQYIEEDQRMRAEYQSRERERAVAEEQRIAMFAREQAQREEERRAVKSAQNEYRERMQQEVVVHHYTVAVQPRVLSLSTRQLYGGGDDGHSADSAPIPQDGCSCCGTPVGM